jgi:hypothetical protein
LTFVRWLRILLKNSVLVSRDETSFRQGSSSLGRNRFLRRIVLFTWLTDFRSVNTSAAR